MGRRDTIKVYIFLACALVCAGAPSEALVGNSPRPFSMDGLDGRSARISAAELRRPVLVHLFSTQRPDWKEELLALSRLYARIKAKGAAVVSIAGFTPQAVRELSSFAVAKSIRFPMGVDRAGGAFAALYDAHPPRFVLIGPDGVIRWETREDLGEEQSAEILRRLPALLDERSRLLEVDRLLAKTREREARDAALAADKVRRVAPEELSERIVSKNAPPLYFIGAQEQFLTERIPGAVRLDPQEAVEALSQGDPKREMVLYCGCDKDELGQSGRTAAVLYSKGFRNVGFLKGHIQEWRRLSLPLEGTGLDVH